VRQTELKQAELEARIETLERIGIEIELKQRDGIWLVTETKGK
jgi:biotin operon repressor